MTAERPRAIERLVLGLLCGVFIYFSHFRDGLFIYRFSKAEGGVWIDEGFRVLQGEVMYRDFFEFLTPGLVYLNAALLWLFGRRVEVMAWTTVGMGALLAAALHALACRATPSLWRLLPPAAFVAVVYATHSVGNHKWPALLFAIAGLTALARRRATLEAAAAGALLALSALCTLDYGCGLTLGTAAGLAARREWRRALLPFCIGWVVVFGGVMGYFVWKAGLSAVVYDALVFPLTYYRDNNPFVLDFTRHWGPRTAAQIVLAFSGIGFAIAMLVRGTGWMGSPAAADAARLVACAGLGLIALTAHRPVFPASLILRCTPLLVCVAAAAGALANRGRRWRITLRAAAAPVLFGIVWGVAACVVEAQWLLPLVRERHRRGDIWVWRPMPELSWVERQTRPGEPVFLLPVKGGLYFLSDTRDPTSVPYVMGEQNPPQHFAQVIAEIERARPALGVCDRSGTPSDLYQSLLASYEPVEELPNGNVLLRRRTLP